LAGKQNRKAPSTRHYSAKSEVEVGEKGIKKAPLVKTRGAFHWNKSIVESLRLL
jgi:hypothetical protein